MTEKLEGFSRLLSVRQLMFAATAMTLTLVARHGFALDFGPFVGGSVGMTTYDVSADLNPASYDVDRRRMRTDAVT